MTRTLGCVVLLVVGCVLLAASKIKGAWALWGLALAAAGLAVLMGVAGCEWWEIAGPAFLACSILTSWAILRDRDLE